MITWFHRKHKYVAHRYKDFVVEVCHCGDYFKRPRNFQDDFKVWEQEEMLRQLDLLHQEQPVAVRSVSTEFMPHVVHELRDSKNLVMPDLVASRYRDAL